MNADRLLLAMLFLGFVAVALLAIAHDKQLRTLAEYGPPNVNVESRGKHAPIREAAAGWQPEAA